MTDEKAKAYINLNGVLQSLTYLCALDDEAKKIIQGKDLTVQFSVKNGPLARLIFKDGICAFEKGSGEADIKLSFSSPEHFNKMVDGKANPGILKGFTKLSFLTKDFMALTKRLEYYLKPAPGLLEKEEFLRINTILTFYTAFNGMAEIGMHDPIGKRVLENDRRGLFCASIENTGYAVWLKMEKNNMYTIKGPDGSPEMHLIFANIQKTFDLLNGKCDFLTAIGMGDVKMKGYMPLMQSVELLVPRLSVYLQ